MQIVYESYYKKVIPDRILKAGASSSLFDEPIEVFTEEAEALKVLEAIREKLGFDVLTNIKNCYLHDSEPVEMELFSYIRLGFKDSKALKNQTIDCVKRVDDAVFRVLKERHKYLGFVRFQKLEDKSFYAPISPENNILPLLSGHFVDRLRDQSFIIHDRARELALVYDTKEANIFSVKEFMEPSLHDDEARFSELWRSFFKRVAISERKNPKLQRQFAPLRYREFMTEFNSS